MKFNYFFLKLQNSRNKSKKNFFAQKECAKRKTILTGDHSKIADIVTTVFYCQTYLYTNNYRNSIKMVK